MNSTGRRSKALNGRIVQEIEVKVWAKVVIEVEIKTCLKILNNMNIQVEEGSLKERGYKEDMLEALEKSYDMITWNFIIEFWKEISFYDYPKKKDDNKGKW